MKISGLKVFSRFTIFAGLLIVSPLLRANLTDDVIGSYAGNIQYSETACTSGPNENETVLLTLTISKVATNNFHGDGDVSFSDGDNDAVSVDFTGITPTTFFSPGVRLEPIIPLLQAEPVQAQSYRLG